MEDPKVLERIGEAVDQLISIDITARGLIGVLYRAAREKLNNKPLAMACAELLSKRSSPGKPIIIATGLPIRGWFSPTIAENDGPMGAATLARAVFIGLKALPVLICEEPQVPILKTCAKAVGLIPTTFEEIQAAEKSPHAVKGRILPVAVVQGFPAEIEEAKEQADDLISKEPTVLISIERQGANSKGVYHYGLGEANQIDLMAKVEVLFEKAKAKGIATIGIGDGGNELGMGLIKEVIHKHVPFGAKCVCPCQSGLAPEFVPDILLCATVSNWGAWGIETCLAAITENMHVLHSPETELNVIRRCTDAGAIDGVTGFIEPLIDYLPARICANMVEILHTIINNATNPPAIFR
jgi:hypothetical protein